MTLFIICMLQHEHLPPGPYPGSYLGLNAPLLFQKVFFSITALEKKQVSLGEKKRFA
jgi:hypothetical protein